MQNPGHTERRRNNRYIMTTLWSKGIRGARLARINRCRVYLQALTIGDIANVEGTSIRPDALTGKRNDKYTRKGIEWPEQPYPSVTDWREWAKAMHALRQPHHPSKLADPAGEWIERNDWHAYYHQDTQRIFVPSGGQ